MRRNPAIAVLALPILGGCQGIQSVFTPRTSEAEQILGLSWILFGGAAVVFTFVMGLLAWAILSRHRGPPLRSTTLIMAGGFIFPTVTVAALLVYSVSLSWRFSLPPAEEPLRVSVVGHMWWWEVFYEGSDGTRIETANEIRLPVGRPVELTVTTADVIHSFWVPNLTGKIDMIPGHVNRITVTPEESGVMRGQCAEFCGTQHALMAFYVVALPQDEFDRWLERQSAPAPEPIVAENLAGRQAFLDHGCGACHAVRGIEGATGNIGPDLTHVGSRLSIAGGWLDTSVGNIAGWISSAQHIKPGNRMPSFDRLDGPTLRALSAWLESLK